MRPLFIPIVYLLGLNVVPLHTYAVYKFDKNAFYTAVASGDVKKIDDQMVIVHNAPIPERQVYEGVLLMRKASLVYFPVDKLRYFKAGRTKIDDAITADAQNAEYHFLRLTIQEHTPSILNYKSDLESDRQYILKHFNSLPPVVQKVLIEYSRKSKILHSTDLK